MADYEIVSCQFGETLIKPRLDQAKTGTTWALQLYKFDMNQFFLCNQDEINAKLKSLTKTGTSVDGWTVYYLDKDSKEVWHLTRFESEYHGGGIPVLKRLPELPIEDLINIAMTSGDKNNIIGASLELSERERNKKEDFRDKLVSKLLQVDTSKLTDFEKERLKIIIYESDLYDETNRRDIAGKHFTEIQRDAEYYKISARKAKDLLAEIKK